MEIYRRKPRTEDVRREVSEVRGGSRRKDTIKGKTSAKRKKIEIREIL